MEFHEKRDFFFNAENCEIREIHNLKKYNNTYKQSKNQ